MSRTGASLSVENSVCIWQSHLIIILFLPLFSPVIISEVSEKSSPDLTSEKGDRRQNPCRRHYFPVILFPGSLQYLVREARDPQKRDRILGGRRARHQLIAERDVILSHL